MTVAKHLLASPFPGSQSRISKSSAAPRRSIRLRSKDVAALVCVSDRTLRNWKHVEFEVPPPHDPPLPRGHPPTLSREEQDILAGYAIYGYLHNQPIDREAAQKFALRSFGRDVPVCEISKYLNARGLWSKATRHYVPQFDRGKFLEDHRAIWEKFQGHLKGHGLSVFFDETAFYLSRGKKRAFGPAGW